MAPDETWIWDLGERTVHGKSRIIMGETEFRKASSQGSLPKNVFATTLCVIVHVR